MTLKIGLTGGIGASKTTVAKIFESLGLPVFYADLVAKKLITGKDAIRKQIVHAFGKEAYMGNEYNSFYVASVVFNDKKQLELLNSIVHPFVNKEFLAWCEKYRHESYVIEEAALLLEREGTGFFDHIIVVAAPVGLRIQRVMERDGVSAEQVKRRIQSQLKEEDMIRLANSVIGNGTDDLLLPQVLEIHNMLVSLSSN